MKKLEKMLENYEAAEELINTIFVALISVVVLALIVNNTIIVFCGKELWKVIITLATINSIALAISVILGILSVIIRQRINHIKISIEVISTMKGEQRNENSERNV